VTGMYARSSRARRILLPAFNFAALLLLWEFSVSQKWVDPLGLAAPSAIARLAVSSFTVLSSHILVTATATIVTFVLSSLFGMALGALLMLWRQFRLAVYPSIVMFQLLPKIALAPLFVVWFGVNVVARLAFAGFIAFFPIVVATLAGLRAADPLVLKLCRSVEATPAQVFWQIRLPYAVPYIFAGLKVGMTLAITGVIIAEFVTAQNGLGYIVLFASSNLQIDLMFVALSWVSLIGLVLYGAVLALEKAVLTLLGAPLTAGPIRHGGQAL
jgi:NitT/TauT family transport system permease protein